MRRGDTHVGEQYRRLTIALYVAAATAVVVFVVGLVYAFGWIGDDRVAGIVGMFVGISCSYGIVAIAQSRRRVRRLLATEQIDETAIPSRKVSRLTVALATALIFGLIGFPAGDAGIGIIFGLFGLVVGILATIPIKGWKRRG